MRGGPDEIGAYVGLTDWQEEKRLIERNRYSDLLIRKRKTHQPSGFEFDRFRCESAFPFQKHIDRWAVRTGRAAIFANVGLGKTLMQLEWAWQVCQKTGGAVLIIAPLSVTTQTRSEGAKFGFDVNICRTGADVKSGQINITNYQMLHAFDLSVFTGVVLDESSILKSFTGTIKRALIAAFGQTPYRLCCTATPSPNDYMELGNHAEFLGVMDSNEMLSRWFLNDSMKAGGYRLKQHAASDFWRWIASWAVGIDRPSDLGFDDTGYDLPELKMIQHIVHVDQTAGAGYDDSGQGRLVRKADLSATSIHTEMRFTAPTRAQRVAELVAEQCAEPWLVWCNTDYEADELVERIPDAVDVRGSTRAALAEDRLVGFAESRYRVLETKPSIAGFGLNYQHCARMAFTGLSYSWEQFYQGLGRCHRFGQLREVEAHVVIAETEGPVLETINRKQKQHLEGRAAMVAALKSEHIAINGLMSYEPKKRMEIPAWLRS